MDPESCLEAAQNAKETRKKIYGYENLGVAKVNDYLNIRKDPSENGELVGKLPKNGGADALPKWKETLKLPAWAGRSSIWAT